MTDGYGVGGGIAEYNRFFLKAFSQIPAVTKVTVLPRRSKMISGEPNSKITILKSHLNRWIYSLAAVAVLLTCGPFDVVWCGHIYMLPLARILAFAGRSSLWLQIHGIEAWQAPSKRVRSAMTAVDKVFSVSRYSRRAFLSWTSIAPENVQVLPNTYDHERFFPGRKNGALLKQFNAEGKKILMTVGRLAASEMYKGHEAVIRLLPELLKKDPDWIYWIIGDGDDRGRLEALVKEVKLQQHVRFLGFVKEDELAEFYRTADLFIMLSKREGFGIVFLEAMACGLPVIAARCGGSEDPLLDGRCGRLVEIAQPQEMLAAVHQTDLRKGDEPRAPLIFSYDHFAGHLKRLAML